VITSQLAGNAVSRIVPGGAAAGAALQFRMLAAAGVEVHAAGPWAAGTPVEAAGTHRATRETHTADSSGPNHPA
jgi:hypothetical protein